MTTEQGSVNFHRLLSKLRAKYIMRGDSGLRIE